MAYLNDTGTIEYRPIEGFPGYRIGSDGVVWSRWGRGGRVRRLGDTWHIKAPDRAKRGYLRVELYGSGGTKAKRLVHRLVLEAFVGPCPEGMEGCHEDGDPANNHVRNLRWDTPSGNWRDRVRHGRGGEGEKSNQAKLTDEAVKIIRHEREKGTILKVLAKRFGVSIAKVSKVAKGESWRHINGV